MGSIRLAMIGCGRAAESLHLPAAALSEQFELSALVDRNLARAQRLADAYGVAEVLSDVADVREYADAAVVALPHHLHAPVTRELLESGLHVLVEKPLALTARECRELGDLAKERGLTLAVGMIRRYFPAARFVKDALSRELLGDVERVTLREGMPFSWEVASDFTFRRETGGGVLLDTGAHVLDLLGWWFGEPRVGSYRDDAFGGVEAECEIELQLPSGVPAFVELSRTRLLDNSVAIEGSRARLEAGTGFAGNVKLDLGSGPLIGEAQPPGRRYHNVRELFIEQFDAFGRAVEDGRMPVTGAAEAHRGVRLLEECRRVRQPLEFPWLNPGLEAAA